MDMEREPNILVVGPNDAAVPVATALRERGLSAWTDRLEHILHDHASLSWADALVLFHDSDLIEAARQDLVRFDGPKVLLASEFTSHERARLLEADAYEYVLDWPPVGRSATPGAALIAAHVERALHRRVLPTRYRAAV